MSFLLPFKAPLNKSVVTPVPPTEWVLYVDPTSLSQVQANNEPAGSNAKLAFQWLADKPQAYWTGVEWDPVGDGAKAAIANAKVQNKVLQLAVYGIPARDLGGPSGGGAANRAAYELWINNLVSGIGNERCVVIYEPDALPMSSGLDLEERQARWDMMKWAIQRFRTGVNTMIYVDAGHSQWLSATDTANQLKLVGVENAHGICGNVSNFRPNAEVETFMNSVLDILGEPIKYGHLGFIYDTGRNGGTAPDPADWANPPNRRFGDFPYFNPNATTRLKGKLWIKRPGESDSEAHGGPPAGQFWRAYMWIDNATYDTSGAGMLQRTPTPDYGSSTPVVKKIMPLGDSITEGWTVNPGGYRIKLWDLLVNQDGLTIDFVGTLTNGPTALVDKKHEGHSGWWIQLIRDNIDAYMAANPPDIIMLHIGTNDILRYSPGGVAADPTMLANSPVRLKDLLNRIFTLKPTVKVLLASIITRPGLGTQVNNYNAAIPAIVDELQDQGKDIVHVPTMATTLAGGIGDYEPDNTHPTLQGFNKMAQTWYTPLKAAILGSNPKMSRPNYAGPTLIAQEDFSRTGAYDLSHFGGPTGNTPWSMNTTHPPAGAFFGANSSRVQVTNGYLRGYFDKSATADITVTCNQGHQHQVRRNGHYIQWPKNNEHKLRSGVIVWEQQYPPKFIGMGHVNLLWCSDEKWPEHGEHDMTENYTGSNIWGGSYGNGFEVNIHYGDGTKEDRVLNGKVGGVDMTQPHIFGFIHHAGNDDAGTGAYLALFVDNVFKWGVKWNDTVSYGWRNFSVSPPTSGNRSNRPALEVIPHGVNAVNMDLRQQVEAYGKTDEDYTGGFQEFKFWFYQMWTPLTLAEMQAKGYLV